MVSCLLVEKNVTNRNRLAEMLREMGISCAEKSSFDEAKRSPLEKLPDLVLAEASAILGVQDFLRQLKAGGALQPLPVVFFYSTAPKIDDVNASIIAGASDFLVWPFDRNLLKFKLQQAGLYLEVAA